MARPVMRAGLILLGLLLSIAGVRTQGVEDEREFTYIEGEETGLEHWGELHEEWSAYRNGQMQSPIDVVKRRDKIYPDLGQLHRIYRPANATLVNRGHDIMDIDGSEVALSKFKEKVLLAVNVTSAWMKVVVDAIPDAREVIILDVA